MSPREVLAKNLGKLMAATSGLSTLPDITKAGGGSNGTLDRIRRKESATGVDNLAPLADVYGLEPWQLLVPDLEATPSIGGPKITGLPFWPFSPALRQVVSQLDKTELARIENVILAHLGMDPLSKATAPSPAPLKGSHWLSDVQEDIHEESDDVHRVQEQEDARPAGRSRGNG